MRNKIEITLIVMAAAMLLAATIVPHHHHSSVICSMIERCAIDGQPNDEHTAHRSDRHGPSDGDCTFSAITHNAGVGCQFADAIAVLPAQGSAMPCPPHGFITLQPLPEQWHGYEVVASWQQLRAPPAAVV